jgi:hypothetical protein
LVRFGCAALRPFVPVDVVDCFDVWGRLTQGGAVGSLVTGTSRERA